MAATLTAYTPALRRIYSPENLVEQLFMGTATLDKIEKTTKYNIGELARVVTHVSRNGGYTVVPDGGGTLNTAGNQGFQKSDFTYTHHHVPISLQEDVIRQTDGKPKALASALDTEVSGALADLKKQLQRQVFMDGSAKIAQCRTSDSNNVDLLATADGGLLTGLNAIDRGWLFVGQTVSVGTAAAPTTHAAAGTITAIDRTNVAFTHSSGNVTTDATTDFVFNVGSMGGSSTPLEMNGLANMAAASGSFGSLATSSEPTWAGTTNSTAQALTISLMAQADQTLGQKTGMKADTIITGLRQERKFYEALQQQVRFGSDSGIGAGNVTTPTWNGKQIIADQDCPDTDMYFLQWGNVFLVADNKGPFWQNAISGGDILTWSQGSTAYVSKLGYHLNLATKRRNSAYRFSALT